MKGLNKRILSRVLLFVFVCQLFATSVLAAVDSNSIVDEVGYVLDYIDVKDTSAINSAYNALRDIEVTADVEAAVSELLTPSFISKFAKTIDAKNALINILSESLAVYYTTDEADLDAALVAADAAIADDFAVVFGEDADVTRWFDLFVLTKKDAQDINDYSARRIWALGAKVDLFNVMDKLQNTAATARLELAGYEDVKTVMEELGWTVEGLTSASRGIVNIVDRDNIAEFALLKAAARSSVEVIAGSSDITPALAGKDYIANADKYAPDSVPAAETFKIIVLDTDVTNLVGYVSTNPDVATITANEADETLTVEYTGERGTTDIILFRDPEGDNSGTTNDWLVRWRVNVINNIAKASTPVWGTDADAGKVSWDAVADALVYTVKLYKDGSLIKTVENVAETTYDFNDFFTGNGSYTVTVQAFGDMEGETGDVSDESAPYNVDWFLTSMEAPEWEETDTTVSLTWDEVAEADSYTVKIYAANSSEPVATEEGITTTNCDLTEFFENKIGSYYATVEAVNDVSTSGESAKSLAYVCKATITGVIKLQSNLLPGSANAPLYKSDNSGITVKVSNAIATETDADGSFSLKVPVDKFGKSYTVEISFGSYLAARKTVTIDSSSVSFNNGNPFMLWFGDFDGMTGVDVTDIAYLVQKLGSGSEDAAYLENPYADCTDDNAISLNDFSVFLSNVGKLTETAY